MKETDLLTNKELREKEMDKIEVLEKVKGLIMLGDTDYATTNQVSKYFDVDESVIKMIIHRNKEELKNNGLISLTSKEVKTKLGGNIMSLANYRGYFTLYGERMNNGKNVLFTKRTILNVAMLLRDSEVAKEIRSRLLDIVYEVDNGNTNVKETIINDLDEESKLIYEKAMAEYKGDYDQVSIITAKLFALKNKRIKELETTIDNINTNALTITESRAIINKLARKIAMVEYNGDFSKVYSQAYKTLNYKLHININSRKRKSNQSMLDVLSDTEIFELEKELKVWANKIGIDVESVLNLDKAIK